MLLPIQRLDAFLTFQHLQMRRHYSSSSVRSAPEQFAITPIEPFQSPLLICHRRHGLITEHESIPHYRSNLTTFPRSHKLWDAKIASRISEKLGFRLNDIGISHVEIDLTEELSRPIHYRKMVVPFFHSVKRAGISVSGSEQL